MIFLSFIRQTKFSDNFSSHLVQINKKNSYFVSINTLFEEIYLKLWSDNIPVLPFQLLILNSELQIVATYNFGKFH